MRLRIENPVTLFSSKLLSIEQASTVTQMPVAVGNPESDYATIQAAIDAGHYSIVITRDMTVTENIVLGNEGCLKLKIAIVGGINLTLQNAVFTDGRFPNPGRALLEVVTLPGTCPTSSGNNPKLGTLTMVYTAALDATLIPFDVYHLLLTEVKLVLLSPTVPDLQYLQCQTTLDACFVDVDISGTTTAALSFGQGSAIRGTTFADLSSANTFVATTSAACTFSTCRFINASANKSSYIMGTPGIRAHTTLTACTFFGSRFGSALETYSNWINCSFINCVLSSTASGTTLGSNHTKFDNCLFQSPSSPLDVSGDHNIFADCYIEGETNTNFSLGGDFNTVSGCRCIFLGTGHVEISGDRNALSGNFYAALVPEFTVTLLAGARENKLIGNAFTGAPTIPATYGTVDIGNTLNTTP